MTPPEVCPICKSPDGIIVTDEHGSVKQCVCKFRIKSRKRLPTEIATATPILKSPLLELGRPGEVIVDLSDQNLFIKAYWLDLAPHLLFVLTYKMLQNLLYPFLITNDVKIRDVFVGSEAYGARSRKNRDDIPTYNSLSDLLGSDYELVVIRLGVIGYKNRALPGALKESLSIRNACGKATWIVEEPNSQFGPGHFDYSPEVADVINKQYRLIDLTNPNDTREVVPRGVEGAPLEEDEGMSLDPVPKVPVVMSPSVIQTTGTQVDMGMLTGEGRKKKGGYRG